MKYCYQCDAQVTYLFGDGRCGRCTRLTPEEVRGNQPQENEMRMSNDNTVEIDATVERQLKWDRRYIELARTVARWSKDPSTKVGAVLVRPNNSVASTGFNGFPPGHDDSPELYLDRDYKYKHVVHAEVNALNFLGQTASGFTLYTSFPCCPDCVERAGKAGVARIVYPRLDVSGRDASWVAEWRERLEKAQEVAQRYGIEVEVLDE